MGSPVTGSLRRVVSTLFVAVLLGAAAPVLSVGVASAGPRVVMAGSAPNGHAPKAAIGILGKNYRFCVKHFAPNSTVTVTNTLTNQSVNIHTNANGAGCATVPVKRACKALTQTFQATGTGEDGNPATVTQTVTVPAVPSLCSGSTSDPGTTNSGGTLPFTGSDIIIPGIIIGVVLIVSGTAMTIVRRRRADGIPA
jgi:hypothetical protein